MPAIIEMKLEVRRGQASGVTGRNLNAAVVTALGGHHDPEPFSVWPLWPDPQDPSAVILRIGWLPQRPIPDSLVEPGRPWRFGPLHAVARAGRQYVAEYSEFTLAPPARSVHFDFASPTAFAAGKEGLYVLPDPGRIFNSVLSRWNPHAGQWGLDPAEIGRHIGRLQVTEARVEVERRTVDRRGGSGRWTDKPAPGFVGTVSMEVARSADPRAGRVLGILAEFANFSGVGYQVRAGAGACRVVVKN